MRPATIPARQRALIVLSLAAATAPVEQLAKTLKVSAGTLYRIAREEGVSLPEPTHTRRAGRKPVEQPPSVQVYISRLALGGQYSQRAAREEVVRRFRTLGLSDPVVRIWVAGNPDWQWKSMLRDIRRDSRLALLRRDIVADYVRGFYPDVDKLATKHHFARSVIIDVLNEVAAERFTPTETELSGENGAV